MVSIRFASVVPATTVGVTRTPSFAMVAKTLVACSAVTEQPCPKEKVGSEVPDQSDTGRSKPADSPGKCDPVLWPKPKSVKLYKEEQLNEISYRRFNESVSKVTPERKITRALSEVKKRIKEIEQVIEYSSRLKDENAVKKDTFWTSKVEQLNDLSERLHELSQNVKKLSK